MFSYRNTFVLLILGIDVFCSIPDGTGEVITIPGQFNHEYTKNVDRDHGIIIVYDYNDTVNATSAIRMNVHGQGASSSYPLQFVVRQQESILAWQVPLVLEYTYDYYDVSRTLCRSVNVLGRNVSAEHGQNIIVEIQCLSKSPTNFTLMASILPQQEFELQMNLEHSAIISPSEPIYYLFTFPEGVESVLVRATSDNTICSIISVQDILCPVYDLNRNVEFTGTRQTMTTQATLVIQRKFYKKNAFYVVLVAKPKNEECSNIELISPRREKNVTLIIEPLLSRSQYWRATLFAVGCFLVFYLFAFVTAVVYGVWSKDKDLLNLTSEEREHLLSTTAAPYAQYQGSNIYSGSSSEDGHSDSSLISNSNDKGYGTIEPADSSATAKPLVHVTNQGVSDYEPSRQRSASIDSNISFLADADREKDVFRTKTALFVSDLARKNWKRVDKMYQLYAWNLITIAIFYGLPVVQLVITYQQVLLLTGDQDICYYNFACSHPLGVLSSFNNVFSNVGYIMLGILFLILVRRRDWMHKKMVREHPELEQNLGIPQHFGLYYAMGTALCMEGVMSACYHVCPNYSNFQFDTSFMYIICCVCMLKIYQSRHPDINAKAHKAYLVMALVIFVAVIGVVSKSDAFWIVFAVIDITAAVLLSVQIYYMGRWKLDCGVFMRLFRMIKSDCRRGTRPMYPARFVFLLVGNIINWGLALYGAIVRPADFASFLIAIFNGNLLLYMLFYIFMKLLNKERITLLTIVYILAASILWGFALNFFFAHLTSWQLSPAQSREGNRDCILLNFYDAHDVWHFLSAASLFVSFMILMTLDDDLIKVRRDRIPVF